MVGKNKKYQFLKIFLPVSVVTFLLVLFWAYGFPPDFRTWRFGLKELAIMLIFYVFPLAIILTLLINWIVNKRDGEAALSKESVKVKDLSGLAIFSFILGLFSLVPVIADFVPIGFYELCEYLPRRVCEVWGCSANYGFPQAAIVSGIIALIYIKIKKLKGTTLAVIGIILGLWGSVLCVCV